MRRDRLATQLRGEQIPRPALAGVLLRREASCHAHQPTRVFRFRLLGVLGASLAGPLPVDFDPHLGLSRQRGYEPLGPIPRCETLPGADPCRPVRPLEPGEDGLHLGGFVPAKERGDVAVEHANPFVLAGGVNHAGFDLHHSHGLRGLFSPARREPVHLLLGGVLHLEQFQLGAVDPGRRRRREGVGVPFEVDIQRLGYQGWIVDVDCVNWTWFSPLSVWLLLPIQLRVTKWSPLRLVLLFQVRFNYLEIVAGTATVPRPNFASMLARANFEGSSARISDSASMTSKILVNASWAWARNIPPGKSCPAPPACGRYARLGVKVILGVGRVAS